MPHLDRGDAMLRSRVCSSGCSKSELDSETRSRIRFHLAFTGWRAPKLTASPCQQAGVQLGTGISQEGGSMHRAGCKGLGPGRGGGRTSAHIGFGERFVSALRTTALSNVVRWFAEHEVQMVEDHAWSLPMSRGAFPDQAETDCEPHPPPAFGKWRLTNGKWPA